MEQLFRMLSLENCSWRIKVLEHTLSSVGGSVRLHWIECQALYRWNFGSWLSRRDHCLKDLSCLLYDIKASHKSLKELFVNSCIFIVAINFFRWISVNQPCQRGRTEKWDRCSQKPPSLPVDDPSDAVSAFPSSMSYISSLLYFFWCISKVCVHSSLSFKLIFMENVVHCLFSLSLHFPKMRHWQIAGYGCTWHSMYFSL